MMTQPRPPIVEVGARGLRDDIEHRLYVHVVVNVESWAFDRPMPRKIIGAPRGADTVPDVPNFSWVEYGMRCGLPRLIEAIAGRSLPASVSFNAGVAEDYPGATAALVATGWEFLGHGVRQESLHQAGDERAVITETLNRIEDATGTRPRGWLGPGLQETDDTLALLYDLGVRHVSDWAVDDLPVWLSAGQGKILAIPYSLELNDSVLFAGHDYPDSEFEHRVDATVTRYRAELRHGPKVLAIPLHPHLMGVPHRIASLERVLDRIVGYKEAVFCTASEIFDLFVSPGVCSEAPLVSPTGGASAGREAALPTAER